MLDQFITWVTDGLLKIFQLPEIVTILVSILPIVEARGAIPIAVGYGIPFPLAWLYAFVGSSIIVPILLLVLLPFINFLSKTKLFKKVGTVIYEKFEKKSAKISEGNAAIDVSEMTEQQLAQHNKQQKKAEWKKILGVFLFVAVPLPLTGVWTGSAVAALLKIKYPKAILAVVSGNLVASGIITLLSVFFQKYINYIILAIGLIAVAVVVVLIIKIILHKSTPAEVTTNDSDPQ